MFHKGIQKLTQKNNHENVRLFRAHVSAQNKNSKVISTATVASIRSVCRKPHAKAHVNTSEMSPRSRTQQISVFMASQAHQKFLFNTLFTKERHIFFLLADSHRQSQWHQLSVRTSYTNLGRFSYLGRHISRNQSFTRGSSGYKKIGRPSNTRLSRVVPLTNPEPPDLASYIFQPQELAHV